jgi:hypothetical protein
MNDDDILKVVIFIILGIAFIYYVMKCMNLQSSLIEGLTNKNPDKPDTVVYDVSADGTAGNAATYAATIKAQSIQLQDELLVSKYRKDYENAIINMDDYVSMLMLKQVLSMKAGDVDSKANIELLNNLNILKSSKDALNTTMTYLDKL